MAYPLIEDLPARLECSARSCCVIIRHLPPPSTFPGALMRPHLRAFPKAFEDCCIAATPALSTRESYRHVIRTAGTINSLLA